MTSSYHLSVQTSAIRLAMAGGKRYQDWDLWKRLLAKGVRGVWVPGRGFETGHGGGMSADTIKDISRLAKRKLTMR